MNRIKCPKCNKPILKTIEVEVKGRSFYYIEAQQFGSIYFVYWGSILKRTSRKNVLAFICRHCHKPFPKEMDKKIYRWLKFKSIIKKLSQ